MRQVLCVEGCGQLGIVHLNFQCQQCFDEAHSSGSSSDEDSVESYDSDDVVRVAHDLDKKLKAGELDEFKKREREIHPKWIKQELEVFHKNANSRRLCRDTIKKYMIASNKGMETDPQVWINYQYHQPGVFYDVEEKRKQAMMDKMDENASKLTDMLKNAQELKIKAAATMQ